MSESVVRVDLRQATLSESARLRENEDAVFIALDNPPPVRSLLRVIEGESARAFEVGRVIEVINDDEAQRGCYGSFIELERLEEQARVGSEHLEPGANNSGVPAPVVIMNTAEMMLGEVGEQAEAQAEAQANADADAQANDSEQADAERADAEQADAEQSDAEQADAEQSDAEQSDAEQSDDEQADAEQSDAEQADAEQSDAEQADAEQNDAEQSDD